MDVQVREGVAVDLIVHLHSACDVLDGPGRYLNIAHQRTRLCLF